MFWRFDFVLWLVERRFVYLCIFGNLHFWVVWFGVGGFEIARDVWGWYKTEI